MICKLDVILLPGVFGVGSLSETEADLRNFPRAAHLEALLLPPGEIDEVAGRGVYGQDAGGQHRFVRDEQVPADGVLQPCK